MRISDWSSDVCSSDLFVGTHYARALADRAGRIIAKCGRLVRELPRRRVEIEPARLHDIACYAQFFRRGEQIAAALLMEPRVVWHGLDDVGGVRGQPGKLVDHHIRRGSCERSRSEEHTSELQSLMRISYAVFCLKKKNQQNIQHTYTIIVTTNPSNHRTKSP